MKLPSKTICQLSALSRALTDPKADDFEAMDTHDMLLLVSEIARAHAKLEEDADDAAFKLMAVKDVAISAIDILNEDSSNDPFAGFYPHLQELAKDIANEILEIIIEEV